jgi:lipopolysaccharide/colanic/teichoic acid biosynthesis glycosyltransferase
LSPTRRSKSADDQMSRVADAVIAGMLLALTLPLMIAIAIAIRWDSAGPVFEREPCVGCRGRHVNMLQFRTTLIQDDEQHPGWGRSQLTRVGRFLRYSRIESLPQLINVLFGDMSIVERDGRAPSFLE